MSRGSTTLAPSSATSGPRQVPRAGGRRAGRVGLDARRSAKSRRRLAPERTPSARTCAAVARLGGAAAQAFEGRQAEQRFAAR